MLTIREQMILHEAAKIAAKQRGSVIESLPLEAVTEPTYTGTKPRHEYNERAPRRGKFKRSGRKT